MKPNLNRNTSICIIVEFLALGGGLRIALIEDHGVSSVLDHACFIVICICFTLDTILHWKQNDKCVGPRWKVRDVSNGEEYLRQEAAWERSGPPSQSERERNRQAVTRRRLRFLSDEKTVENNEQEATRQVGSIKLYR